MWWYMPLIPVLTGQRKANKLKAFLVYMLIQLQDSQSYIDPDSKQKKQTSKLTEGVLVWCTLPLTG